jgi:hypothetical protein
MEVKQLAPHPPNGTHHRGISAYLIYTKPEIKSNPLTSLLATGYSAPGREKVVQHLYEADELKANRLRAPDVKESFESGNEDDPDMPNIWPPEDAFPGFRNACNETYWVCCLLFLRESLLAD